MLDRLEAAFSKRRAELLASDAESWALFVQPTNRCHQPFGVAVAAFDIMPHYL